MKNLSYVVAALVVGSGVYLAFAGMDDFYSIVYAVEDYIKVIAGNYSKTN